MSADRDRAWVGTMPEAYERGLVPTLFLPFAHELAARAAVPPRPERVLELAAGTGVLTGRLAAALPEADITATDLNAAMVQWGARAVPTARWQQADAQRLPFPDGRFDLVCCQFGVTFFPDRPAAYAQALRVLVPGGRLLLSTWDRVEQHAFGHALTSALDRVFPDDPPTFLSAIPHGYPDPDLVAAELRAAGFGEVRVEPMTLTGQAPSAAAVATGFCTGTPLRAALEARGELAAATDAVAERMTALLGAGPVSGPMRAYIATAVRPDPDRPNRVRAGSRRPG